METDPSWLTTVLPAIIGAIVGAIGAFTGNYCLQNRKEKNDINGIRILIKLEVQNNLKILKKILDDSKGSDNSFKGLKLADLDFKLNTTLWDVKTPLYGIALKADEINQIENFNLNLREIQKLHVNIWELRNDKMVERDIDHKWMGIHIEIGKMFEMFEKKVVNAIKDGDSIIIKLNN